jgi:hypothetical protein
LREKFRRWAVGGKKRAVVAVAHGLLLQVYQVLETPACLVEPGQKSIEVSVRPRKGSAAICSRCHQTAPGYDQLAHRRFELIPLWGFFGLPSICYAARGLPPLRSCGVEEVPWGNAKHQVINAERTTESFQGFFATIGGEITSDIVFVCSDMREPT